MHHVIDTPWNCAPHAQALKSGGVASVIRYFNHSNSTRLPEKRLEPDEADTLAAAGLSLVTVFQQRGGAGGKISDLDRESGERDAARALELAERIGQSEGSTIYFAVDHDYWMPHEIEKITPYFDAVATALKGKYRVGSYGSGKIGAAMRDAGHVDMIWLAAATGWAGTKDMLKTDQWALYQEWPPIETPLPHDGNLVSPAWHDYGQFVPNGAAAGNLDPEDVVPVPNSVLLEVTARSGLKLRRGPGQGFTVETALPHGSLVHGMGRNGDWVKVDVEGDGLADGYMHGGFLKAVAGGLPIPLPQGPVPGMDGSAVSVPYAIALSEMSLDVSEVPGPGNNPRIVMYHNSTHGWAGTDDSVPWCSSFMNYCVEQAGQVGTKSQAALSWRDWGVDAMDNPREGDIAVFTRKRPGVNGGHVGFWRSEGADTVSVLGGNQSDRVKVTNYPKDGKLGSTKYKLVAIRRPG